MKLAILGGGSCFALSLARVAGAEGHELIGIGRSMMKPACFALEFAHPRRDYRYYQAHVVDQLPRTMALLDDFQPEWIVNFAAQGEGAVSHERANWPHFYRTNLYGLSRLCSELASRKYLKRFIQVGTSELYGSVIAPVAENALNRPSSIYAHSKAAFDDALMLMHAIDGFPANIVRPSNCYVKGQQLHRIVPRTLLYAMTGRTLYLHGGGVVRKSYLHADDLARAILLVAEKAPLGKIYNVGPDDPVKIRDLVALCAKYAGRLFDDFVKEAPERAGGQDACYWLDSWAMKQLGWRAEVDWERGLADTAAWVSAYKTELAACDPEFHLRA